MCQGKDVKIITTIESNREMILRSKTVKRSELRQVEVFKSGFLPRRFQVDLKERLTIPPDNYPEPEKIFAVSDIEGNFNTLINLLQQHDVVDEYLHWEFGKGHLVINGDVFDRGYHVTEMLWLIYQLENEAEKQGGRVHLILGNHEVINLRGDLRYITAKYVTLDSLVTKEENLTYIDLFGLDSELGCWLRTKNAIERIGNKLFSHTGISMRVADSRFSIREMNKLVRSAIDKTKNELTKNETLIIRRDGILWDRSYFQSDEKKPQVTQKELETILSQYGAEYFVVGHTILDHPVRLYQGRLCAIDVDPPNDHQIDFPPFHAFGVLIVGNQFYRACENGYLVEI